jgi:hypothetical protein
MGIEPERGLPKNPGGSAYEALVAATAGRSRNRFAERRRILGRAGVVDW